MILKLVRATISALLQVALLGQWRFRHFPGNDRSPSTTIDILPEDALLEVFDSYRQDLEQHCFYLYSDLTWNSKCGWLKLAHVCRKWRCTVLSSPFRLQAKLFFNLCHSNQNLTLLTRLPPLPIVIYSPTPLEKRERKNRAVAALRRYSDHVNKIVLDGSDLMLDGVRREMSRPFPALQILELSSYSEFNIPTTIFGGSIPSLRHLHLRCVSLASLSSLPSTPGLAYLKLEVDRPFQAASLLTILQGMPCLHRLDMYLSIFCPEPRTIPEDVVHLSRLKYFYCKGHKRYLEAVVAGLAAPSLQTFDISVYGQGCSLRIPYLSRFIRDVEGSFLSVHVMRTTIGPRITCMDSHSLDHVSRKIVVQDVCHWLRDPGGAPAMLCTKLSTIEHVLFQCSYPDIHLNCDSWPVVDASYWLDFFQQLQNVKIVKMQSGDLLDVAQFFMKNGGEPPFRFLPALEEIELRPLDRASALISNDAWEELLSTFSPFVAARQQAGCPVRIFWNANPETFPPAHPNW
ncbi:hypothetical protein BGW80DRAFT_1464908 [Lactifluus volemus]|nr:hypothetical protein BGW80DRAFT_1464908 [Lactifluus volemus]